MIRVQDEPIRVEALLDAARGDGDGAVAIFVGAVRDHHEGRAVARLEYHAYREMAEAEMRKLADLAVERHGVSRVAAVHRVGTLDVGDVAVAVAVASPHRAEALAACSWFIETLKRTVPIWKREHGPDGEVWLEGHPGDGEPPQS